MEPRSDETLGLFAQIRSFNAMYWISNIMEMFERLAYYGLRTVLPIYMVLSVEAGGPQFNHLQKGSIYAWWALMQSGLPVFTGGYADRYGYKFTVGVAIAVKMFGYLLMAYAVNLALFTSGGASAGVPGHWHVYLIFLIGALGLAGGTAIFKPGLQGIIGLQLTEATSSVGWSVFYQVVNVGGFLGPFLAGWMRLLAWKYVFVSCAIIVSFNYVFLFAFPEPDQTGVAQQGPRLSWRGVPVLFTGLLLVGAGMSGKVVLAGTDSSLGLVFLGAVAVIVGMWLCIDREGMEMSWRPKPKEGQAATSLEFSWGSLSFFGVGAALMLAGGSGQFVMAGTNSSAALIAIGAVNIAAGAFLLDKVLWHSAIGICEPRLMSFLVVFSGFWAMFNQLFDLLPNYIDDWVDSSGIANMIAAPILGLFGSELPAEWGGNLPQEYMINLNAGMCMTFAFLVGFLTSKVRSMTAMIGGILLASTAIWALGLSTNGWMILLAIAAFSFGELMSSPTKMRYFSNIAPPGKKGLYLGYINATGGIGWYLGSLVGGELYEKHGDKVVLARRYLIDELGQTASVIHGMPKDQVVPRLAELVHGTPDSVRSLLMEQYDPSFIWTQFALLGLASMVGLIAFDRVTAAKLTLEPWLLTVLTGLVSWYTYGWQPALFFVVLMLIYLGVERFQPSALPSGQSENA